MPWHQHDEAYAAIVLDGRYIEAGDDGRRRVGPGDVIIHPPFSAHANWFTGAGVTVVNVPLAFATALRLQSGRVTDPEALARMVTLDPARAGALFAGAVLPTAASADLPDQLAADLSAYTPVSLRQWAAEMDVPARTLRRQFTLAYGVSPLLFRTRSRARRAWVAIVTTERTLTQITYELGFADQAHMSRAVRWLSGRPPGAWRRTDGRSVQD